MNALLRTLLISATLLLTASLGLARDTLNVEKIGEWGNFFDYATYAEYQDGILYVSSYAGIQAVDASDPTNLTPLGHYDAPISYMTFPNLYVYQNYGYFFDYNPSESPNPVAVEVVDFSNPTSPRRIATIESERSPRSVGFYEDFMYIQDRQLGIRLIDISDPERPGELDRLFPDSSFNTGILVNGNRGYFGGRIYDLTNPREPQWLGYGKSRLKGDCFFGDSIAVASGYDGDLYIMDVSDPAHCTIIDTLNFGNTQDLIGYEHYLIRSGQNNGENGLAAYDMSDPANPQQVGELVFESGWRRGLAPGPEGAFFVDLVVFTFDEENGFQVLDTLETNGQIRSTAKIGDRMIVCCGKGGVRGIDVSNPTNPHEVQQYDEFPSGVNMWFFQDGNLLFVRGFSDGRSDTMKIYNCEDVERPELLSQIVLPFPSYYSLTTENGILTAIYGDTLYTINYDNPREPRIDQTVNLEAIIPHNFEDLAIGVNKYFFAISNIEYYQDSSECPVMAIINRNDPERDPVVIYDGPKSYGVSVTLEGDKLFLLTEMLRNWYVRPKLTGYDISDPDNPVEIFSDTTTIDSTSQSVFIEDGHLFVWFGGYGTGRQRGYDVWDAADIRNMHYLGYTPVMGLLEDGLCYTSSGSSVQIWDFHESLSAPTMKDSEVPEEFGLLTAYPNPFNSTTLIRYRTSGEAFPTRLGIYGIDGRLVEMLTEEHPPFNSPPASMGGKASVIWNASGIAAGSYFIKLESGGSVKAKKIVLVK